jgi:hypothetical protein
MVEYLYTLLYRKRSAIPVLVRVRHSSRILRNGSKNQYATLLSSSGCAQSMLCCREKWSSLIRAVQYWYRTVVLFAEQTAHKGLAWHDASTVHCTVGCCRVLLEQVNFVLIMILYCTCARSSTHSVVPVPAAVHHASL